MCVVPFLLLLLRRAMVWNACALLSIVSADYLCVHFCIIKYARKSDRKHFLKAHSEIGQEAPIDLQTPNGYCNRVNLKNLRLRLDKSALIDREQGRGLKFFTFRGIKLRLPSEGGWKAHYFCDDLAEAHIHHTVCTQSKQYCFTFSDLYDT
mmetsp:Transcript_15692/g.23276  ORF Transcript_15692/g.23276 Transcript_15692/m.23276 type:complete len:151 (+) Transcript_15692:1195-1647(+)